MRTLPGIAAMMLICHVAIAASHPCEPRSRAGSVDLSTATLQELSRALETHAVTSEQLVRAYLRRIRTCDRDLHAIIAINPAALAEARKRDAERLDERVRGPLHGVPIVIKDNIDLAGMATTAGSLALTGNMRADDAVVVSRLRAAGLVVIAKTNLSEWANFRSRNATSGWSAVGGLTANAVDPKRTACGSSSGSAVAVALRLAPAAIGTETNGSIVCPASVNGIVGLKPTVGLIPGDGIVPISRSQDTAGPMTATVADAALLMAALSPDALTAESYRNSISSASLRGVRLGVARFIKGYSPATEESFRGALQVLRAAGATLIDIDAFDLAELRELQLPILLGEFKTGIDAYLGTAPPAVETRTLADLIAFNRGEPRELRWFGQDLFELAQATAGMDDPAYLPARVRASALSGAQGIDRLLRDNGVEALVAPTTGPAWSVDFINGDRSVGSAALLPAISGRPHLTVPMQPVAGMPVGLSFFGFAGAEPRLIALGQAFETARGR
jgi:amidase